MTSFVPDKSIYGHLNRLAIFDLRFRSISFLVFLFCLSFFTGIASKSTALDIRSGRIAVVIGNANYLALTDIENATNDSNAIAQLFQEFGYHVLHRTDLDKGGFNKLARNLTSAIPTNSTVLFYYAGHGFQVGSENYLVPVDSKISDLHDVQFEAVSLSSLIQNIGSRASRQLFFLDSCRDNPFEATESATGLTGKVTRIESGFSYQPAPVNSFISFSTSPGSLAFDGEGENSPYTAALLRNARNSGKLDLNMLLSQVRQEVYRSTNGAQISWETSSLLERFALVASASNRPMSVTRPVELQIYDESSVAEGKIIETQTAAVTPQFHVFLSARFEREIEIGKKLASLLSTTSRIKFSLTEQPSSGYLGTVRNGNFSTVLPYTEVSYDELINLRYFPILSEQSPTDARSKAFVDTFELSNGTHEVSIEIGLNYSECDLEAGGMLDPQGIGISVHDSQIDPQASLAACSKAIWVSPKVGRFNYQYARALRANRKFDRARYFLQKAKNLGHIRAYAGLGISELLYPSEQGGYQRSRASERVLNLFREGVKLGDPLALYSLGRQYLRYGDNPEIKKSGYELLIRAMDAGQVEAINELGAFFLTTSDEYFDADRGLRFLEASADSENINGLNSLGLVLKDGISGITKDPFKAVKLFERAVTLGHPNAATNLGRMYSSGTDVAIDYKMAVEYYEIGLSRGDPWAGANGAYIIVEVSPDGYGNFDAAVMAAKAAVLGDNIPANRALFLLNSLSSKAINGGAQQLLNELGYHVDVDGMFGIQSFNAFQSATTSGAEQSIISEPLQRLLLLSKMYWQASSVRVDVY